MPVPKMSMLLAVYEDPDSEKRGPVHVSQCHSYVSSYTKAASTPLFVVRGNLVGEIDRERVEACHLVFLIGDDMCGRPARTPLHRSLGESRPAQWITQPARGR